jgi:L-ascorbate metabolism protein UlaG (beta-lactamase superfamily)
VPAERIVELDWWETVPLGDVSLHAVPSRHASGRQVLDQNRTLWAGFALIGPDHRVLFSGDTGIFSAMTEIGERLGPFDVTMIEVGAYAQAWPDWHLGPEQAIEAHQMMQGDVFLPIHWGLFNLAPHGWTEPIERAVVEAERLGIQMAIPRPGQSFEPATFVPQEQWWPERPWRTADEYPIEARGLDR